MKPTVVYVDDEANNLTIFEASMPEDWEIHTFTDPLKAIDKIADLNPHLVVSDQRMPGLVGVRFLELVKKICPDAIRFLVTGFSDEDLIIESVRTAQVSDYIRKPWDTDDLVNRVKQGLDRYQLEQALKKQSKELEEQNKKLTDMTKQLEESAKKEIQLRHELEAWVPPFVLEILENKTSKFPMQKDLAVMTFDLINSADLHDVFIKGKPARKLIIQQFSELVIRYGGWRESHSGDSAYAHFGMIEGSVKPCEAALAVSSEFRSYLNGLNQLHGLSIECGIGLHFAKNCLIDLHVAKISTPQGEVTQKSFDSTSSDIDLVHRIEKLSHELPGSSVMISEGFIKELNSMPPRCFELGSKLFKGQSNPVRLFIKPSDKVNEEILEKFKKEYFQSNVVLKLVS